MWTRKELKQDAKEFLRRYYWKAFVVCLLASILTSGSNGRRDTTYDIDSTDPSPTQKEYYIELGPGPNRLIFERFAGYPLGVKVAGFGTLLLLGVGSVILTVIIGNLLIVGEKRFFINAFKTGEVKALTVFSAMKKGQWLSLAGKMFLLDLYLIFWFLLLIVPGIIKTYQYKFVPYILAENPEFSIGEAIDISTQLTDGEKIKMFDLDLSFIGWHILGSLFFGIGSIFVAPYQRATFVKLYEYLRGDLNISLYDQFS